MLKISSVYLNNDSVLSHPDGMCIVVAVATGRRNILHQKAFLQSPFHCFLCVCVGNTQHVNSFAARHFLGTSEPFQKASVELATVRERGWPSKDRRANKKCRVVAELLEAPSCICESPALCWTTSAPCSRTLVQLLLKHMPRNFWGCSQSHSQMVK